MAIKSTGTYDLAREYVKQYGTEFPTAKVARIMYNENKLLFTNTEHARAVLRKVTGKSGERARKETGQKELFDKGPRPKNPYNLPASDEINWTPFILKGERILVLSDIHIPYHNVKALTAAFDYGKKRKPDVILLNGDIIDFYGLSRFAKDPNKRKFAEELETFRDFITSLRKAFPKARIVFKEGNHEERYNAFLYQKAKELAGVTEFQLESIIRTRAGEVEYIGEKRIIKAGNLNIIHGHEFATGFFSPVNVARGLFLRGKVSAMQGHNHATSEHSETDMNGKIITTWSVGCLSELHPLYMPINKWNHGFAFVEVGSKGEFEVHNKRINDGKVL